MKSSKLRIIVIFVIVGFIYGFVSAIYNQNPYYSPKGELLVSQTELHLAWHWEPSPVWFSSYVLCKVPRNGLGICHTRSGYLFRSQIGRVLYFTGSTVLGIAFGAVLGIVIIFVSKCGKTIRHVL